MTHPNFNYDNEDNWFRVGRFSQISPTEDGQREFLEAIPSFMEAKDHDLITETGYLMPNVGTVVVGHIVDIELVADDVLNNEPSHDGIVFVKKA